MNVNISGGEGIVAKVAELNTKVVQATKKGLYMGAAAVVMPRSVYLCPVLTGALRSTAHVEEPVEKGGTVSVTLGYGGPGVDYAVYVHEIIDNKHAPPTQAKFLEQAAYESVKQVEEQISISIKAALAI